MSLKKGVVSSKKKTKKSAGPAPKKASASSKSKKGSLHLLEIGSRIRDRQVLLTDGRKVSLSSLSGEKGMILYFYPKDNTPGCTKEACSFRDGRYALLDIGYSVVGVSKDSVESHQSFSEKFDLNFPLISDETLELIKDMGVWQEKKNYGKTFMGILRTTYALNLELEVVAVFPSVKVESHAMDILAELR